MQLVGRLRELPANVLDTKAVALLERLGLGPAVAQGIHSYSKGMKQRLLIVAALLHDPDVLILDEPESGLDATSMVVLRHLLKALAARGKAAFASVSGSIALLGALAATRWLLAAQARRATPAVPIDADEAASSGIAAGRLRLDD